MRFANNDAGSRSEMSTILCSGRCLLIRWVHPAVYFQKNSHWKIRLIYSVSASKKQSFQFYFYQSSKITLSQAFRFNGIQDELCYKKYYSKKLSKLSHSKLFAISLNRIWILGNPLDHSEINPGAETGKARFKIPWFIRNNDFRMLIVSVCPLECQSVSNIQSRLPVNTTHSTNTTVLTHCTIPLSF